MKICVKCGGVEFYSYGGCKACKAAYYLKNKDKIRLAYSAWEKANPEKKKAKSAIYRKKHKEQCNAATAKWAKENPEQAQSSIRAWRKMHPEKGKQADAKWRSLHPEAVRIKSHNRRAKKRKNGGKLSQGLTARLMVLQNGKCACCQVDLTTTKINLDHIMPLALGGPNVDTNIQLLCQSCNNQKHAKHPIDFMQSKGFLL